MVKEISPHRFKLNTNRVLNEHLAPREELIQLSQEISTRLIDERLIPRHDANIGQSVLNDLQKCFDDTNDQKYQNKILNGVRSLNLLVPAWKNDDLETQSRLIGGKTITPGIEKLIKSRSKAGIVDLNLDQYPLEVQQALQEHAYFVAEGVNACTVACNYCPVADIGSVGSRLSYETVKQLMTLNQKPLDEKKGFLITFSGLYNNTDIFDWEGEDIQGNLIDYTQLLKDYRSFLGDTPPGYMNQPIGSSTSIPWGSELRVLESVLYLGSLRDKPSRIYLNSMRISVNNTNAVRASAIKDIADALTHLKKHKSYGLSLSPNRDQSHMESGRGNINWQEKAAQMNLQDIISIECSDKVVFAPFGLRNDFGVALTEDNKIGNQTVPFVKTLADESIEYRIIHNSLYLNEENKIFDGNRNQEIVDFPDPIFTVIRYDRDGKLLDSHEEVIHDSPARTLFKLCRLLGLEILIKTDPSNESARTVFAFCDYNTKPISINSEYKDKERFLEVQQRLNLIRNNAKKLQEYLDAGNSNQVMSMVLSKIKPLLA